MVITSSAVIVVKLHGSEKPPRPRVRCFIRYARNASRTARDTSRRRPFALLLAFRSVVRLHHSLLREDAPEELLGVGGEYGVRVRPPPGLPSRAGRGLGVRVRGDVPGEPAW